ncbi:MAG: hypothetical protein JJE04_04460 [Acidobacteriia bacterium]|nr:hypothetical protein [Terriglobia bacterium]
MGFWREEIIDPALDQQTRLSMEEQMAWIAREPHNARPYYQLALLYRMQWRQEEALGLLLESVRLDPGLSEAHCSLAEIYGVRKDYPAAWRHARAAQRNGSSAGVELLARYGIPETLGGSG